jgi:hypothetical protein
MEATSKWRFSQDSHVRSFAILEIKTLTTLDAHNMYILLIEVRFEEKL